MIPFHKRPLRIATRASALALRQTTGDPELGNFMPRDGVLPGPCSQSQVAGVGPTIAGFLMAPEPRDAEAAAHPLQDIDPATIVGEYDYAHPVFDLGAIEAQKRLPLLQGQQHTWYAGAWTGYGFHEDGLKSGLQVGRSLLKLVHEQANPVQDRLAA